jgi:two-component system cell cycle sensor histidine kinase/response regulator CckA
MQRSLAEAQKAETISHLTSAFTHELNNILTIILGVCDIISVESDEAPRIEQYIDITRDAVNRASTLSTYFQKMGRKDESVIDKRSLNEILHDILNPLLPLLRDSLKLTCSFDPQVGTVRISRTEFESVIFRLLVADREELSLPKNVSLRTRREKLKSGLITPDIRIPRGSYAVLSVTYSGKLPGLALSPLSDIESIQPQPVAGKRQKPLFPFLSRLVEQAGGYMHVRSDNTEVTVEVWLPIEPDESTEHSVSQFELLKDKIIFVLEDDKLLVSTIKASFQLYGARVIEAVSIEDAKVKWEEYSSVIDIAILDVILPEGNGSSIFRLIRGERADLPVLFISGYDKSKIAQELTEKRVAFLQKPFGISQLVNVTLELLSSEDATEGENP